MQKSDEKQKFSADEDGIFGSLNLLNKLLQGIDERGLVLSLAAFAEDALGLLLKAFMLPIDAAHQLLEGFNAPLGTFSSRIKAAYALGLITKDQFEDLEHLRKIRNELAHSWHPITFAHPKIAGHIKALNYSSFDDKFPERPFDKLRSSISSLLTEIRSATHQIKERNTSIKVTGSRLITIFNGEFDQKIEAAQRDLINIDENLNTAIGEKLNFYKMLLGRLETKVSLLFITEPKNRHLEIARILDEVKRKMVINS